MVLELYRKKAEIVVDAPEEPEEAAEEESEEEEVENDDLEEIFCALKALFLAHIRTKRTAHNFHAASDDLYPKVLEFFHTIAEKRQDLVLDESMTGPEAAKATCDAAREVLETLNKMAKTPVSEGMTKLLQDHIADAEDAYGTAEAMLADENK